MLRSAADTPVDTPVDTTAAGDAFVGAFAAAVDAGAELPDALQTASIAGGQWQAGAPDIVIVADAGYDAERVHLNTLTRAYIE